MRLHRFTVDMVVTAIELFLSRVPPERVDDDIESLMGNTTKSFREVVEICLADMVADKVLVQAGEALDWYSNVTPWSKE
jgi:hypothetical protein